MTDTGQHHIKHLDGLRGIAIILVLLTHFSNHTSFEKYFKLGWTGVDLFFVLSGFLITGILLDSKDKKGYYRIFITRRILRILPVYYGVLICCFFLSPYFSIINWFRDYQFYFWTYTQNYLIAQKGYITVPLGHFWSLAIEEQFYLVWPFVVLILKPKQLMAGILILMLLGILIRFYHPSLQFVTVFTPAHMDGLLTGAGISILIRTNKDQLLKFSPYLFYILTIVLSIFIVVQKAWDSSTVTFIQFGFTLIALFFGSLLVFSFSNNWLKKILSIKILRWFGKYSYGIYVYHAIIINVTKYYFIQLIYNHALIVYITLCLMSLGVSYLSYHIVEKHFLKKKPSFKMVYS